MNCTLRGNGGVLDDGGAAGAVVLVDGVNGRG